MQLSLYTFQHHVMNMYGILEKKVHPLLTSTLDGGEWLVSGPVCFTPRKRAWVPRMGLDTVESVAPVEFINVERWSLLHHVDFIIRSHRQTIFFYLRIVFLWLLS